MMFLNNFGKLNRVGWYIKRPKRILSRLNVIKPDFEYKIDWKNMGPLNPDKKFLILRVAGLPEQGQLSAWSCVASDYRWCEKNGIIPVIDYEPYTNFDQGKLFTASEWQEVFSEPNDVSIEEILQSRHVGIKSLGFLTGGRYRVDASNDGKYYKLELEYIKKNFWFQPEYLRKLEVGLNSVIASNAKILAVSVREEFELLKKAGWSNAILHPDEPPVDEVLEKAVNLLDQWDCEYCFISTRYESTIKLFKKRFGDRLLFIDRERITIDDEYISYLKGFASMKNPKERLSYCLKNEKFAQMGKNIRDEYLLEVYVLSKCSHLLATKSGASTAAMYWNGGEYEQTFFFEDRNHSRTY